MEKFARRCDATGRGMNEGYVVGDGEMYFSEKEHLLEHLKKINNWCGVNVKSLLSDVFSDDELLEYFYEQEYYYYTEWEEVDEDCYYDADGNEYEF